LRFITDATAAVSKKRQEDVKAREETIKQETRKETTKQEKAWHD
jgi:hypothetical protein